MNFLYSVIIYVIINTGIIHEMYNYTFERYIT